MLLPAYDAAVSCILRGGRYFLLENSHWARLDSLDRSLLPGLCSGRGTSGIEPIWPQRTLNNSQRQNRIKSLPSDETQPEEGSTPRASPCPLTFSLTSFALLFLLGKEHRYGLWGQGWFLCRKPSWKELGGCVTSSAASASHFGQEVPLCPDSQAFQSFCAAPQGCNNFLSAMFFLCGVMWPVNFSPPPGRRPPLDIRTLGSACPHLQSELKHIDSEGAILTSLAWP